MEKACNRLHKYVGWLESLLDALDNQFHLQPSSCICHMWINVFLCIHAVWFECQLLITTSADPDQIQIREPICRGWFLPTLAANAVRLVFLQHCSFSTFSVISGWEKTIQSKRRWGIKITEGGPVFWANRHLGEMVTPRKFFAPVEQREIPLGIKKLLL